MNADIDRESYNYFLQEAQDLLQDIEQELLSFKEDPTTARVHNMMRSAHTLKGSAASVGLEVIKEISHVLEDAFKTLYNPEVVVDEEIESLLFQGYECLRLPLMAHFNGGSVDESSMLDRAAGVISQLQEKLGDKFDTDPPLPTSEELGFDVVKSIFETGVEEKLTDIENASSADLATTLQQKAEVFLGLGESLNLPGYGAIAEATLKALENYPDEVEIIAQLALADFRCAQQAVLNGDRAIGGEPSEELLSLAQEEIVTSKTTQSEFPITAITHVEESSSIVNPEDDALNLDSVLADAVIDSNAELITEDTTPIEKEQDVQNKTNETLNLDDLFAQAFVEEEIPTEIQNETVPESTVEADCPEAEEVKVVVEPETNSKSENNPHQADIPFSLDSLLSQTTITTSPTKLPTVVDTAPKSISPTNNNYNSTKKSSSTINNQSKNNQKAASVRVELEQLERLNHLAGELLIEQNQQTNQDKHLRGIIQGLLAQLQQHKQTLNELRDWSDRKWLNTKIFSGENQSTSNLPFEQIFDPLEMDRYDNLQLLIQKAADEAIQLENLTELVSLSNKQSRLSREAQQRLLTNVRDDLTTARMQPLGDLFNRFPRVLKQLVGVQKKPAELVLKGKEVLIDKAIVEKLYDPLLHLIRNAYDHGIDLPEARLASNKPEVGYIKIQAYNQGNRTIIEVKDDGRGINIEKIANKAIESGLITPAQAQESTKEELLDLLFEPGFSTANAVTDLSGRGVGLDVVRSQLQSLNGSVNVQTISGRGTTFTLEIPLSLTITELLVCQAKEVVYAIPVNTVEQILIPGAEQLKVLGRNHSQLTELADGNRYEDPVLDQRLSQQPVLHWQQGNEEVLVPLYKLSELTEYSTISSRFLPYCSNSALIATEGLLANHAPVILLRTTHGLIGLQVEQLLGEKELVIRTLGSAVNPPAYVYGSCILSNSDLALVLDIEKLIDRQPTNSRYSTHKLTEKATATPLLPGSVEQTDGDVIDVSPNANLPKGNLLLVVDDSLTLRQTLTKALNKFGYQVIQAENGKEAIAKLQQIPNINLVVCDVEMPHLNGFEFLSIVSQDRNLGQKPIVMLTSRSAEKYRKIAQELGASAYLTKPFIEQELLSTIDELLTAKSMINH
ncbi:conserved hypothetical protein [Hyella patelloides LEGE 07179]|uniref:histidine kinase n=1 Tax=Hyella patelloides LEGE 07179 TaxID=945734 RepID=A0A563VXG0_9CYAN|nr:hybrid sensor histidine kinase/response regulator [Hyella patelloides]VEP16144.1 conserved hypothetical protein [Hyella patelloides LEGE 07179]